MTPEVRVTGDRLSNFGLGSLAVCMLIAAIGCSPDGGRVTGTVQLNGKPLTAGNVHLVNNAAGVRINATINKDGTFETFLSEGRGLPVGEYQIAITEPVFEMPIDADPATYKPPETVKIPKEYQDPATSKLTYQVVQGENEFNISLP